MATQVTGPPQRVAASGTLARSLRDLPRLQVAVAVVAVVVSVMAMVVSPPRVLAPQVRVPFELLGGGVVVFAAMLLAVTVDEQGRPARNALIAGLLVLGLSNAVTVLRLPIVDTTTTVTAPGYVSWVAARYVAAAVFLLGTLERPEARRSLWVVAAVGGWLAVEVSLSASGVAGRLHIPAVSVGEPLPWSLVLVQLVPAIVFGVGSWLAAGLLRRTGHREYWWLALALEVQVVAQIHEAISPSFQGAWLTSSDLLRLASFILLMVSSTSLVRRLSLERLATIHEQQRDLVRRDQLLGRVTAFADREAHFRTLVGHELATPLATINAYVHVIGRQLGTTTPGPLSDAVDGLGRETRRLAELAARMDELRDLDDHDFACDLRAVPARGLLEDSCRFARTVGTDHTVTCEAEDAHVAADPVRFGQALRNVLANSLRYAPSGTTVAVTGQVSGGRYVVSVLDEGPGIPAAERERVVSAYARGQAANGQPGHGVGLYLAAQILAAHDGRLIVEPQTKGALVRLEIELSR